MTPTDEQIEAVTRAIYAVAPSPRKDRMYKIGDLPFEEAPKEAVDIARERARAAIAAMDIEKIERDAYERGMCDAVELDEWGKSKLFYRKGYGDGAASLQIVTSTTTGRMPKDER